MDWDEAATGGAWGSYFAAWNFVQKSAEGGAVWAVDDAAAAAEPNVAQSRDRLRHAVALGRTMRLHPRRNPDAALLAR